MDIDDCNYKLFSKSDLSSSLFDAINPGACLKHKPKTYTRSQMHSYLAYFGNQKKTLQSNWKLISDQSVKISWSENKFS